jgi:hypothetical protein
MAGETTGVALGLFMAILRVRDGLGFGPSGPTPDLRQTKKFHGHGAAEQPLSGRQLN